MLKYKYTEGWDYTLNYSIEFTLQKLTEAWITSKLNFREKKNINDWTLKIHTF